MHPLLERFLIGSPYRRTIAKFAKGVDRYLGAITILAAALLGLGLASPVGYATGFYGISGKIVLVSDIVILMKSGQGSVALMVGLLFILLPILNISTAFDLWYKHPLDGEKFEKFNRRANLCGRLWYLGVLSIGALIYKLNTASDGVIYPAIYYLLMSSLLQKFILTRLTRLTALVTFVDKELDEN
ncbi:hypothetical protein [Sneathiella limimaris]|uniref:hypothetical protein n=1 Tax=Sneathiella limimaris TaxID=1964213 RepID=UPI00146B1FE4|nr:hypothetical protein [Sneathiella limimaris]